MTFSLRDHWVWDFWTAVDGDTVHLFYLRAPKSLIDPDLRHRNAAIGHATSTDYIDWTDHGVVLEHGGPGDPDESATWTGSVFRDPTGLWRMFYTGSRFLSSTAGTNVETVLMATSVDLRNWVKIPEEELVATAPWYETLTDATWREEAWRDPWIVPDPSGAGWHMLITARARDIPSGADPDDRGVIGHAVSSDLISWTAVAPLSAPGAGFAHLEVPQLATIDGREVLLFSCDTSHLAGIRAESPGGIWILALEDGTLFDGGLLDMADAQLLVGDELYAGRIVQTSDGAALLGFENAGIDGEFIGRLSDPRPVRWTENGLSTAAEKETTP
jgi:beta-fructofuranosidase